MLAELRQRQALGQLRAIDYLFAEFVAERGGGNSDMMALTASVLSLSNGQGDVCLELDGIAGKEVFPGSDELELGARHMPSLDEWMSELEQCPWVGSPGDIQPMVLDGLRLYLGKYWQFEQGVADQLLRRLSQSVEVNADLMRQGLEQRFGALTDAPDWQRIAATVSVLSPVSVITGGPGTGKTTTVLKVLLLLLEQQPLLDIRLLAPTGKAAARLSESITRQLASMEIPDQVRERLPNQVSTIHRFLRPDHRGRFRHNNRHPVVTDLVIVDEVSMVDLPLMSRLLDALPETTRLIFLGDRFQLSSVEAGSVLADICGPEGSQAFSEERGRQLEQVGAVQAGLIEVAAESGPMSDAIVELRHSYRFDAASGIGALAGLVNQGETRWADYEQVFERFDDVAQYDWGQGSELPGAMQLRLMQWYGEYLRADGLEQAWQRLNQVRVLSATRQGVGSVEWMNQLIEEELSSQGLLRTGEEFYHGRPIMVTRNDYGLGIFNGDVGLVWEDEQGRFAWFEDPEGGLRPISVHQLPEHETAYALTVHKSQGSEYDRVLMVLPEELLAVVTRELIYTGITRAKSELALVSNPEVLMQGCGRRTSRGSGLAQRLGWA